MTTISVIEILEVLKPRLDLLGLSGTDINTDVSLLEQGVLDSISFLEFVVKLEQLTGKEVDFGFMAPEQFTSLNKLLEIFNAAD